MHINTHLLILNRFVEYKCRYEITEIYEKNILCFKGIKSLLFIYCKKILYLAIEGQSQEK